MGNGPLVKTVLHQWLSIKSYLFLEQCFLATLLIEVFALLRIITLLIKKITVIVIYKKTNHKIFEIFPRTFTDVRGRSRTFADGV